MKKNEKIYDAIADISDEKIESAADHKFEKPTSPLKRILLVAAAAALCIGTICTPIAMMRDRDNRKRDIPTNAPSALRVCAAEYPEMGTSDDEYSGGENTAFERFFAASTAEFLKNDGLENKIISPLNIYTALGMLAEGSGGNSRREVTELLGENDIDMLRLQMSFMNKTVYADSEKVACKPAASLWMANNLNYNKDTLDILAKNYSASSFVGETGSKEYNEMLKEWLNEQTNGILSEYADEISMNGDTVLELLTTLYFNADWQKLIEAHRTSEETFHTNGGDVSCDFMKSLGALYYEGEKFCAATKEFADESYSMSFILPNEGIKPDELFSDSETIDFIFSEKNRPSDPQANYESSRNISVPKFDITSKLDLIPALKELGISDVFDGNASDFSPLFKDPDGVYVSKADHAVRVKIDEAGCESAAYTDIQYLGLINDMIVFDRPFIFTVNMNGFTLFAGIVNNPAI